MNYWNLGQLPVSYFNPKNTEVKWSGSDSQLNLDKNPHKEKWRDVDISYKYNAHGFRTYDLTSMLGQKVDIAVGCSHTEGIGLPAECIWPTIIEQSTGIPLLNLGVGAGSGDTVARILTNIVPLYQVNTVYIWWPNLERFERYTNQGIHQSTPQYAELEEVWYTDEYNSTQRRYKNELIVNLLSNQFGFEIKSISDGKIPYSPENEGEYDRARDGMHNGIGRQKVIANMLMNS